VRIFAVSMKRSRAKTNRPLGVDHWPEDEARRNTRIHKNQERVPKSIANGVRGVEVVSSRFPFFMALF
jgi:hypothetical protein